MLRSVQFVADSLPSRQKTSREQFSSQIFARDEKGLGRKNQSLCSTNRTWPPYSR
uniref:Uncharacterized protein n=1 Tax=Arundo donax TaxID=35708 RepID=A0A0A8ZNF3_ARUDO